jgi:hypothetical protein
VKTVFYLKTIRLGRYNLSYGLVLWFLLSLIGVVVQLLKDDGINNYKIFEGVYYHASQSLNLYQPYPKEYGDTNHYGPVFSLIIMPFAVLPKWLGCILFVMANSYFLYVAVKKLPLKVNAIELIIFSAAIELMQCAHNTQFNPSVATMLVWAYVCVLHKKDFWATALILLGFYIKLYTIVGLVFFFFSQRKWQFVWSCFFWAAVWFVLPMIISSPSFIIDSYQHWFSSLSEKNALNLNMFTMQNISFLGMVQRIFGIQQLPVLYILLPAACAMLAPLLRFSQLRFVGFQLYYLAATLITVIIFSTGSENSTYIVAFIGAAIYFVTSSNKYTMWYLIAFVFFTTILSTDIGFFIKPFIIKYSLKSLPSTIIWFVLIYNLLTYNFKQKPLANVTINNSSTV